MITDQDINKLKKVFVTKPEAKKESDRIIGIMVKEFKTVIEMIGDTNERMDKRFDEVDQRLIGMNETMKGTLDELRSNRIILGNHESRIQKLEHLPSLI